MPEIYLHFGVPIAITRMTHAEQVRGRAGSRSCLFVLCVGWPPPPPGRACARGVRRHEKVSRCRRLSDSGAGGWLQVEEALLTDNPDDTLATGAWMLRLLCSSAACLVRRAILVAPDGCLVCG